MERRAPLLAGLLNLIGARRLKAPSEDYLLSDDHGTDELFSHSPDDTIVHPACKGLYDDLIKICEENIDKHWKKFAFKGRPDCSTLVDKLWNDKSDEDDLVYQVYLAPNVTGVSIPVFWSGFSWTLGTRQTMDAILSSASTETLVFRDIEHKDTAIGQALRDRNWSRACHASKHDSNLWVGLSKIYASSTRKILEKTKRRALTAGEGAGTGAFIGGLGATLGVVAGGGSAVEAGALGAGIGAAAVGSAVVWPAILIGGLIGGVGLAIAGANGLDMKIRENGEAAIPSMVLLLINYHVEKLEKDSFLIKHELKNLHAFNNILVFDFKNHCSPSLVQMIASHTQSKPVVSCLSASEFAVRRGKEQLSSIGDYEKILPHIKNAVNRTRETLALSVLNKTQEFVTSVDSMISSLELCYTHGIVWRTPAQPIDTSVVMGNDHEDDITECQKRCGLIRDCSRFNLFAANQTCQLLTRNATLYYEAIALNVTSGRPQRKCHIEDAERAAKQNQIREELKTRKGSEANAVTTVDVTSVVRAEAFKKSGYRCCCDKRKIGDAGRQDDKRGISSTTRANYCTLDTVKTCGDVKVRYDTEKAHDFESTGGKCDILRDDVPVLVKSLTASDYCLYYKSAALNVISGRPNCIENADRATMEKNFREELERRKVIAVVTTIDVASVVRAESFKKSGYRCCCDKRKIGDAGRQDDRRGISSTTRANYCTLDKVKTCGDVKVRYDTEKAHDFESTGGKCDILRDDVPVLVKSLNASDY